MPIEWKEPPPAQRGQRLLWDDIRSELIARSGEWALVMRYDNYSAATSNAANALRSTSGWHGHVWEAACRKLDDGQTGLWVRHIREVA